MDIRRLLLQLFNSLRCTADSSEDNTAKESNATHVPVTENPTIHSESKTGNKTTDLQPPVSTKSAPDNSTTSGRDDPATEDSKDGARGDEESKDGAPAHLIPNSEHYHASSNVKHILEEAEKADKEHRPTDESVDAAGEAKNEEAAPQKADKAKGQTEEDKSGAPAPTDSDEPAETSAESGYKPSRNVEHILADAKKADEEHRPEDHTTDQDEEAKKMDNPTAGATNASHPQSEEPAVARSEKQVAEERHDDEPAQTTTESGYTPSDNVKQILAQAEKTDEAKNTDEHNVDESHGKNLDEPTANMSVHDNARQEN